MATVPALAGTFILSVIEIDGEHGGRDMSFDYTPVVAYNVEGNIAFPVTIKPFNGLTKNVALALPDEHGKLIVFDRYADQIFDSPEDWFDYTQSPEYERPADPAAAKMMETNAVRIASDFAAETKAEAEKLFSFGDDEQVFSRIPVEEAKKPAADTRLPDKPAPVLEPRVFGKKSYWRTLYGPNLPHKLFYFEIEAGQPVPAAEDKRFEKITGADFKVAMTEGFQTLKTDWRLFGIIDPAQDAPAPAVEEDDDDVAGLI